MFEALSMQFGIIVDTCKICVAHLAVVYRSRATSLIGDIRYLHNNQNGPHCCTATSIHVQIHLAGSQNSGVGAPRMANKSLRGRIR